MSFKNYNGPDKYHFRVYKKGKGHPFIVAVVEETEIDGKMYISGYMFTHSVLRVLSKPNDYIKMEANPNPNDDAESFLCIRRVSHVEANAFSKPYNNWHLSKEDEKTIDELEKNYFSK
ncbi:MAG: hypothetical protein IJ247_07465 [Bacilli bacterium]|nr:hypothetical protein [Bacilli bacterium]